jgi:hypothetical protein
MLANGDAPSHEVYFDGTIVASAPTEIGAWRKADTHNKRRYD